jgi:hypothetical protein
LKSLLPRYLWKSRRSRRLLIFKVSAWRYPILWVLVGGLLSACAAGVAQGPPEFGQDRSMALRRNQKLLAEFDGWRVWELTDDKVVTCMAVKPVTGTPWPEFSRGRLLPSLAYDKAAVSRRMVSGGAGFFMYILNEVDIPYFGFYGRYPYRLPSVAELNGKTITDTDNQDNVLAWEGQAVSFKLNTQPSEASSTVDETTGTVNFTGVNKAFQSLLQCHSQAR